MSAHARPLSFPCERGKRTSPDRSPHRARASGVKTFRRWADGWLAQCNVQSEPTRAPTRHRGRDSDKIHRLTTTTTTNHTALQSTFNFCRFSTASTDEQLLVLSSIWSSLSSSPTSSSSSEFGLDESVLIAREMPPKDSHRPFSQPAERYGNQQRTERQRCQ